MRAWALGVMLVLAAGCSKKQEPSAAASDSSSIGAPAQPGAESVRGFTALARAPIEFFDTKCARCHGPEGSFYGEAFAALASDRDLHDAVRSMVEGPAQAQLDDKSLFALVALHRSMRDGTPFAVVTKLTADEIAGEAGAGTAVSVVTGAKVIEAKVEGSRWRVALTPGQAADARVRIARGGRVYEFDPREQAWSDAPPPTLEEV